MQIGRHWWDVVESDDPIAPRGLHWGDVDWFKEMCEREGLVLGWSVAWQNYVVMEEPAPGKWVFLMHCRQGGLMSDIIPLSRDYWDAIVYIWDRTKNRSGTHEIGMLAQLKKDAEDEALRQMMEQQELTRNDEMESLWLEQGYRTPNVAPLPKKIVTMSEHRKASMKKADKKTDRKRRLKMQPHEVN